MKKEKSAINNPEPPAGFDYASFEKAAIKGLSEGKDLVGKDGVLTGLIQRIVNAALEG